MRGADRLPLRRRLKRLLGPLARTPFHPQWLAGQGNEELRRFLAGVAAGSSVLDIGCADQWPRHVLPAGCLYRGLDLPETAAWYGTRPEIYANAEALPIRQGCIDVVLLFDVLEHLSNPEAALAQIHRSLKNGGLLCLKVPFLYPIHDRPHDYTRWTGFGLNALAQRSGFAVQAETYSGRPVVTAALLTNLSLSDAVLRALETRSLSLLFAPLIAFLIPIINVAASLLGRLFGPSDFMPFAYQGIWVKQAGADGGQ